MRDIHRHLGRSVVVRDTAVTEGNRLAGLPPFGPKDTLATVMQITANRLGSLEDRTSFENPSLPVIVGGA